MSKNTLYAVVDIETTGTNPKIDRIIQFGCVLIEKDKIVSSFATDVNPSQCIPKHIEKLTGIKNSRAAKAPYFEDVAYTIYQLLSDCVFVAHNIHFDYKFLNHELQRCGMPALKIPGIDTVELAQIFLPTESSFRLSDLAASLHLEHVNPHQADSDAQVTAELFLYLKQKIKKLPLVTLEKIVDLSVVCSMNTQEFLVEIFKTMRTKPIPLASDLQIINNIALKRKSFQFFSELQKKKKKYPQTSKEKRAILSHQQLVYRKEQEKMMDAVHQFCVKDTPTDKNFLIEAATGTGKTLGYLFPLSFEAKPEQPVIISTASLVLQNQMMYSDIPLINHCLDTPIQAAVVKSHRHYLDIYKFYKTLGKSIQQKQYVFYQMRVLIWLTETQTGDLEELNVINLSHFFWNEVRHKGLDSLDKKSPFYSEDFLLFSRKKQEQSNFLITNHAYLCQESIRSSFSLPKAPYLVIDEAHHLSNAIKKTATIRLDLTLFHQKLLSFSDLFLDKSSVLFSILSDSKVITKVSLFLTVLEELDEYTAAFFSSVYRECASVGKNEGEKELLLDNDLLNELDITEKKNYKRITILLDDAILLTHQILSELSYPLVKVDTDQTVTTRSPFSIIEYLETAKIYFEDWKRFLNNITSKSIVRRISYEQSEIYPTLFFYDFDSMNIKQTSWYSRYSKIVYTGATLRVGNSMHYLCRELGLSKDTPYVVLPNPYDYEKQARLYLLKDDFDINNSSDTEYIHFLSKTIQQVIVQQKQSILILFTSHDSLRKVYHKLHMWGLNNGREILAQGISGGRDKIIKRFAHHKGSILLGADSFWEGIDLPKDLLQVLVVTRLPFEPPGRLMTKAKYAYLESQNIHPFYQEAVPKAAMRLCQGFGRLIRSEEDKGVMLLLDSRFYKAKYGKQIQKALPADLPIIKQSLDQILLDMESFFKKE